MLWNVIFEFNPLHGIFTAPNNIVPIQTTQARYWLESAPGHARGGAHQWVEEAKPEHGGDIARLCVKRADGGRGAGELADGGAVGPNAWKSRAHDVWSKRI